MTCEQQLENLLAEIYGAVLEVGLTTPSASLTREAQTVLYHLPRKMEAMGIKPWTIRFVEPQS